MAVWIDVKDRIPECSGAVLVWEPERQNEFTAYWRNCICRHCPGHWYFFGSPGTDEIMQEITHWQPLPDPPATPRKETHGQ